MAERQGFEPWEVWPSTAFKAAAFDHSAISPKWCLGPDLNRHGINSRGILSPLCLPIPPPRHGGGTRIRTGDQSFAGSCLSHLAIPPTTKLFQYRDKIKILFFIGKFKKWSGKPGSNRRPSAWKADALANWATPASNGGRGRIWTFEGRANGFTVRPLWPLGNSTKHYYFQHITTGQTLV